MVDRLRGWIIATAAMLCVSAAMLAQTARQPALTTTPSSASTPDLSGFWDRPPGVGPRESLFFTSEEPPMQPWAAERYKEIRKGMRSMTSERPDYGRADLDPGQYPYCMPFGFPRVYAYIDGFEIMQTPGRVYAIFQSSEIQRIYTDGRTFPKGPPLTFMGQSIGHWEGDTLVVETKDMNELTWMDNIGHLHSDALRVEQRIRRVDHDTLEMNFLFDDPKTYTKPWGGKKVFKLHPSTDLVLGYFFCEDPTRQDFLQKVLNKREGS
jgi:hypothetical protein